MGRSQLRQNDYMVQMRLIEWQRMLFFCMSHLISTNPCDARSTFLHARGKSVPPSIGPGGFVKNITLSLAQTCFWKPSGHDTVLFSHFCQGTADIVW